MAKIKCPECQKDVSDQAISCTSCGYPIQDILQKNQENHSQEENSDTDVQNLEMKQQKTKKTEVL